MRNWRKIQIGTLLLVLIVALGISPAQAETSICSSFTSGFSGMSGVTFSGGVSQEFFTPGISGSYTVGTIELPTFKASTGSEGVVTLHLANASSQGFPTGTDIAIITRNTTAILEAIHLVTCGVKAPADYLWTFNTPITLDAGRHYVFYITQTGTKAVSIPFKVGNPYGGGIISVNSGSSWTLLSGAAIDADSSFQIWQGTPHYTLLGITNELVNSWGDHGISRDVGLLMLFVIVSFVVLLLLGSSKGDTDPTTYAVALGAIAIVFIFTEILTHATLLLISGAVILAVLGVLRGLKNG